MPNAQCQMPSADQLFLNQIRVAGHALPGVVDEEPSVGKTSSVVEGPAAIGALGVVRAGDDGGVRIEIDLHVVVGHEAGAIVRIFNVSEKARFVLHRAVVVGVHKLVGDEGVEGFVVVLELSKVPGVFEGEKLALVGRNLRGAALAECQNRGDYKNGDYSHPIPLQPVWVGMGVMSTPGG